MKRNKLIKKIILGGAQFGMNYGIANKTGKIKKSEREKIFKFCLRVGIKTLDMAENYGLTPDIFEQSNFNRWNIYTKLTKKNFSNFNFSNPRLKGVFIHHYKEYLDNNFRRKVRKMCKKFKIKFGVSIYKNYELTKIIKNSKIDLIQIPLNILSSKVFQDQSLYKLKCKGIKIFARSVFLQGILTKENVKRVSPKRNTNDKLLSLSKYSQRKQIDLKKICLNWALHNRYIDNVILGIDNLNQLKQNINNIMTKESYQKKEIEIFLNYLDFRDSKFLDPTKWVINRNKIIKYK